MALTVGTNTYLSLADANAYFSDRLYAATWTGSSDADKERALLMARSTIDRECFLGSLSSDDQLLAWPRAGVYDCQGRTIAEDQIPDAVKHSQCELALAFLSKDLTADNGSRGVRRRKVGPIETEYDGRAPEKGLPDVVGALLRPFLRAESTPGSIRIVA